MGYPVPLETASGRISGWRCDPPTPARGALVVIQEIFGVNAHIRRVVDRFAAHGFIALAPAFFDHLEPGVELAYDAAGVAQGRALAERLGFERVLDDVRVVQRELQHEAKVGAVGFCWGGTAAFLCNARLGLPAVSFYGGRTVPFLHEALPAPMLFHFGERDPLIPPEALAAHREHQPRATFHVYPAAHGFNCEERDDYHAESSAQAMEHTVSFFTRHLQ